jgi:hypothetical protein
MRGATLELRSGAACLVLRSADGVSGREVNLALLVDDQLIALAIAPNHLQVERDSIDAAIPMSIGAARAEARLHIHADFDHDAVTVGVSVPSPPRSVHHSIGLSADWTDDPEGTFVSGLGPVTEAAAVAAPAVVSGLHGWPLGAASGEGDMRVQTNLEEGDRGESMHLSAVKETDLARGEARPELHFIVGASTSNLWGALGRMAGENTAPVRGRVLGAKEPVRVVGRDASGKPRLWSMTDGAGLFAIDAPTSIVQWYAIADAGRASGIVQFVPGTPRQLMLDVSPGGEFRATVVDADTREPLTARLIFQGLDGTVDPNFGPDYRATGAGPIIDALRGAVTTPLPAGRYRVSATKGIEWSIDSQVVDIARGHMTSVEFAPRHVVPTPGIVGCDLHVHARPSFDSRVTPEDRVLSLAAAGIDFAVPTEHNVVGDYSSAIEALDLTRRFASVPGVEVTTYNLGFGHFGVFPFSPRAPVPPFVHTNVGAIFRAVRSDARRYFQLNHPRLPGGIGYFNNIGFDPQAPRSHIAGRVDFDGIEVYNGFDIKEPDRVDQVLRDYWALLDFGWRYTATGSSDSHRIQYQWAGYPRTMVTLQPAPGAGVEDVAIDPVAVVENLKAGHATVTSGPLIEFTLLDASPGDEVVTVAPLVHGHLRVRAAPWVDLTEASIVVGQVDGGCHVVQSFEIPSQPTQTGPEVGTLEEAQARTVRFDRDLEIPVGPANGWVQVVAHGSRLMSDVLPFVPVAPLAFTNPVYVVRQHVPPPPFPGVLASRPVPSRNAAQ